MDQKTWEVIDQIAEREAEALRRARRHRSVWFIHRSSAGLIHRDQALFDEQLTLHFTHCSFCGAEFRTDREKSVVTQDVDLCHECRYVHTRLLRSEPPAPPAPRAVPM